MSELAQEIHSRSRVRWGRGGAVQIIGQSPVFKDILRRVHKVAAFDEPVLITGESGVGKELLAKATYLLGPRANKPFVCVNCPQYQEGNLTVSELFGHTRGSFTGATADRKGCFETANEGVVFLDEVGDLHMSAQVMLLRALANGEFQPLGSDSKRRVNVRVVAATNRPLDTRIGAEFRNDLFFRLRYFSLSVPPLRERGDDWRLLLEHFMEALKRRHGIEKQFSTHSLRLLSGHAWPGNVRELECIATTGYAMAEGDTIEPEDFESLIEFGADGEDGHARTSYARMTVQGESFWDVVYKPFMRRDLNRREAREVIRRGLQETNGRYKQLLPLFNMRRASYQRFMDFLRHQKLKP